MLAGVAVKPNPGDAAKALLAAAGATVEVIRDPAAVPAAVSALLAYRGPVGFDIETAKAGPYRHAPNAGLDPHLSAIRLMQFAAGRHAYVFDLAAIPPALLEPLFARPLVAHNAVFEFKHCLHAGINPALLHCTLLMDRVLSGRRRSLAEVAKTALGWELDKTLQTSDWSGVLTAAHYDYAALDAATADRLFPILKACELSAERSHFDFGGKEPLGFRRNGATGISAIRSHADFAAKAARRGHLRGFELS